MACRMDSTEETWACAPVDWRHPLAAAVDRRQELLCHDALRQTVRQLARSPSQDASIFCFLKPPLGGQPIAFAR